LLTAGERDTVALARAEAEQARALEDVAENDDRRARLTREAARDRGVKALVARVRLADPADGDEREGQRRARAGQVRVVAPDLVQRR
jgi:hypothetical protein